MTHPSPYYTHNIITVLLQPDFLSVAYRRQSTHSYFIYYHRVLSALKSAGLCWIQYYCHIIQYSDAHTFQNSPVNKHEDLICHNKFMHICGAVYLHASAAYLSKNPCFSKRTKQNEWCSGHDSAL